MAQDKAEKKRKRKRAAENGDHPSKKVVIDSPSQVVKVSILQDTGDWAPVIATTPGLSLSSIPAFKPYQKPLPPPTTRPSSTARSSISATSLLLHSSHHPKLDYTAREEDSHAAEPLLKHYIGVYNPTTSDLQVLEARNLVLRSSLRPTTAETPTLGLAFGTQKSRKAISARTENAIRASSPRPSNPSLDPLASATLATLPAPSASSLGSPSTSSSLPLSSKPIPPPNLAATSPRDVYPLTTLIGAPALRALRAQDWVDKVRRGEEVRTGSRFVSARLERVVRGGEGLRVLGLRYLALLVEWFAVLKAGREGVGKKVLGGEELRGLLGGWEEGVLEGVRGRFADGGVMNKWAVDNLITHVCALALAVDDFEVDTYLLREDLRLENKEITQYFRELGCKVMPMSDTEIARLKLTKAEGKGRKVARLMLPLEFPKVRVRDSRRR